MSISILDNSASILLEKETLMNDIKILSKDVKDLENTKNYTTATEKLGVLIVMIKNFIDKNKTFIPRDNIIWYNTLIQSYEDKKKSYEYFSFLAEKTSLIKKKMTEKYLGNNKNKNKDENVDSSQTQIEEYEFVKSSSSIDILKDIIEIAGSLIKYYEIQIENNDRNRKNFNVKQVQSFESFYIYDYQNNSHSHNIIDRYIEEVKGIKSECESLLESNELDGNVTKGLQKQIGIIKEEFQKIYPKYINLRELLKRNNLIREKDKEIKIKK